MLRITLTENDARGTHLILEGRLVGPWVPELQAAVTAARNMGSQVQLGLAGVNFVDAAGLRLLQQLLGQGVVLNAATPFVRELLNCYKEVTE